MDLLAHGGDAPGPAGRAVQVRDLIDDGNGRLVLVPRQHHAVLALVEYPRPDAELAILDPRRRVAQAVSLLAERRVARSGQVLDERAPHGLSVGGGHRDA